MTRFTTTRTVQASLERTFEAFTDLRHAAENIRGIKKLEVLGQGPVGVGTRFRETRVLFKREATEEMEITAFERPSHYTVSAETCGSLFTTTFRSTPENSGTRVDLELVVEPITTFAKLVSPLGKLMLGSCMKQFEGDLDDMTAVAEGRSALSTAPAGA
jgi:hypothetical protein